MHVVLAQHLPRQTHKRMVATTMNRYDELVLNVVDQFCCDLLYRLSKRECQALARTVLTLADMGDQNPLGGLTDHLPTGHTVFRQRLRRMYFDTSQNARLLTDAEIDGFELRLATDDKEALVRLCVTEHGSIQFLVEIAQLIADRIPGYGDTLLLPEYATTQRLAKIFVATCGTYLNQCDPLTSEEWSACDYLVSRLIDGRFGMGYHKLEGITSSDIRRATSVFEAIRAEPQSADQDKFGFPEFKRHCIAFANELSALATLVRTSQLPAPDSAAMMELSLALEVVKGSWSPPT